MDRKKIMAIFLTRLALHRSSELQGASIVFWGPFDWSGNEDKWEYAAMER